MNLNKTKDGIPLKTEEYVSKGYNTSEQNDNDTKNSIEFTKDATILSPKLDEKSDSKLEGLISTLNDQIKRIEKLEGRVSYRE